MLTAPLLRDDAIVLEPLAQRDLDGMLALARLDDVIEHTRVPPRADAAFVRDWIARYERAWGDGSAAGFSIRDGGDNRFIGFAAAVAIALEEREAELGYMVLPEARGRGIARRSLDLITRWCIEDLGLERLELRIDPANEASTRIARRAGYTFEGVLRNLYVKPGRRGDTAIWSLLRDEFGAAARSYAI